MIRKDLKKVKIGMKDRSKELLERYPELVVCREEIEQAFEIMRSAFASGRKLLVCGNGGSAADADHFCAELLKGFSQTRALGPGWREKLGSALADNLQGSLPAVPLPAFTGLLTAFGNDCDPLYSFAQLTWGLGRAGDVLLSISTSGNSRNVLHAVETARAKEMKTVGLTGQNGGALKDMVDLCIRVPATEVYKIQEYHLPVYHCLCLWLEDVLFPGAE